MNCIQDLKLAIVTPFVTVILTGSHSCVKGHLKCTSARMVWFCFWSIHIGYDCVYFWRISLDAHVSSMVSYVNYRLASVLHRDATKSRGVCCDLQNNLVQDFEWSG